MAKAVTNEQTERCVSRMICSKNNIRLEVRDLGSHPYSIFMVLGKLLDITKLQLLPTLQGTLRTK